jgi:hypothetical protein
MPKIPSPKIFDSSKYVEMIAMLDENMPELQFERQSEVVVPDILENYEGFERIVKGPKITGTPFDFFGFKDGCPYIIEFKSSLKSFNYPGETQKRRLQEIHRELAGLHVALLQVKLLQSQYRIFYDEEMNLLYNGPRAPIDLIVEWLSERMKEV